MGGGFSFGGMNGMHGNDFDNGEDAFFGMGGFQGMNGGNSNFRGRGRRVGGMPQNGGFDNGAFFGGRRQQQQQQPRKLPPLVVEVPCSLEQLNGCVTRKLKVRRNINGREEEKFYTSILNHGGKMEQKSLSMVKETKNKDIFLKMFNLSSKKLNMLFTQDKEIILFVMLIFL